MSGKGSKVIVVGAAGIASLALISALTKKAKAQDDNNADNLVEEALATLLRLAENTQAKSDAIIKALESLDLEVPMESRIEQIPFAYNLAALQWVTLEEIVPFDGRVIQVDIHWPDGCNALVDVRIGHKTQQFCPREGYLALNDITPTYPFNIKVKKGDPIWVEMRNTDGVNPHNITVTVSIEGAA